MLKRRDILEELEEAERDMDKMRPGTANSDVNTFDLPVEIKRGQLYRAVKEIRRLRTELAAKLKTV